MAFSDDDDEAAAATKNRAVPLFATQRDRLCTKRADIDDDDVDGDENCRVVALRSVADLDDNDDDANVEVDALVDIPRADCAHMVDTHDLIAFLFGIRQKCEEFLFKEKDISKCELYQKVVVVVVVYTSLINFTQFSMINTPLSVIILSG